MQWDEVQAAMRQRGIDAWLVYDFRGSNPVFWQLLGERRQTSRRVFLCVPSRGEPRLLGSVVEPLALTDMGAEVDLYTSRQELSARLGTLLKDCRRVAMEYSPGGELPILSWVDGGTLDMVRAFDVEVVSSADLCQVALATWSPAALEAHIDACRQVAEVKDEAFEFIRYGLENHTAITEYEVQSFISAQLQARGLDMGHPAIVAVNAHSGNPHYENSADEMAPIKHGDWILIDLWARHPGEAFPFADMTWVACASSRVPAEQQQVFELVKEARDLVVARAQEAWEQDEVLQGWQLDRVARLHIEEAGYGSRFVHRTGHSLGPGPSIHALGANLDDLETHDTREILPSTGFSVEPGIYLTEFGVRLEIDVYVDAERGPIVTTPIQDEIVLLA